MKPIPISSLPVYLQAQAKAQTAYATSPKTFPPHKFSQSHGLFKTEELGKAKKKTRPTLTPDQAEHIVRSVSVSDDGNEVKVILNVNPQAIPTAQQKGAMAFIGKDGRAHNRFYTKAKIANAEKALILALEPHAHLVRRWSDVPIEVEFDFYFPFQSGTPKCRLHRFAPMMEKSDVDNLMKAPLDSLTRAGFWSDDSIVNNIIGRKRRTTLTPHIVIRCKNLQPLFDEFYRSESGGRQDSLFNSEKQNQDNGQQDSL